MDVTPLIPQGSQIIQAYSGGHFRVSGQVYNGPVIVTSDKTVAWAVAQNEAPPCLGDFSVLFAESDNLDVVLVGCGARMGSIPFALRQALKERGLAVEFMDTGAACRTYNVLMAEGRRVAAALLTA